MTDQTQPAFNLLDEPWIPVRFPDGEVRDVSLTQAVLEADRITALAETSPPNLIALYRMLLALLHRALTTHHGPWKDADRARWYRESLPETPIRAYLDQWRERFWLFHPEHPFMQVASLSQWEKTNRKLKPWTQLTLERSGADTPLVFDHSLDMAPEQTPYSIATRSLLGYLQFTPGGLVKILKTSDCAGPLAASAAVVPIDATLARTLLLALHAHSRDSSKDLPSWEKESLNLDGILGPPTLPSGHNDRYTRLTRSVLFTPSQKKGHLTHLYFAEGLALAEDNRDPMICARVVDGESKRVSFAEGRSIWRDLPSMVPDTTGKFDIQASALTQATELTIRLGDDTPSLRIIAAGWKNARLKAAKVIRWRLEEVNLPQQILQDPDCSATIRSFIRNSETLFSDFRRTGIEMIVSTMPDPRHKDTRGRARTVLDNGPTAAVFFSSAERALPELMQRIAAGDVEAAYQHWASALKRATQDAWDATRIAVGDSPAALRAQARAFPKIQRLLRSLDQLETKTTREEVLP